jgi:RNA polymerase sigma factor (sigma-70 family)
VTRMPAPDPQWLVGVDADLEEALADLTADQREAIVLRVAGDLTYKAIGSRTGCTPAAARIRVSRGLRRLRARLEANPL